MKGTITQYLAGVASERDRAHLRGILAPIGDRLSTQALRNSTLVIGTDSTTVPKTGAADSYFSVKGKLVNIAAGTAMPTLVGTVALSTSNVFCFFVDDAGAVTSEMGTGAADIVDIVFPPFPEGKALIGFVLVTQSGGGAFTGGTTGLDDGTTTDVYASPTGSFDPSVKL